MSTDTSNRSRSKYWADSSVARQIKLPSPILTNEELEKLRHLADRDNRVGDSELSP